MANTLEIIDMITSESLLTLHESLSFVPTINRSYDDSFGKEGAKIGDSLRIRKPARFEVTTGRVMNTQPITDEKVSLTVATQKNVSMQFTSAEMALGIDYLSDRYIKPAMQQLAAIVEYDVLAGVTPKVGNLTGTAGTAMSDLAALGDARSRLNGQSAPMRDRSIVLDSLQMSSMVNGLKGLFQDSGQIKEAMREGFYGRLAMGDLYENEKLYTLTNAGDVAGTLNTVTLANGATSLSVANFSAAPTAGMVFTLAGVYACHPETKQSLGYLKQFVIGTVNGTSTTSTLYIDEAIYVSGARQNVVVSSSYSTTGAVTFVGSASTSYRQGLMYHKDAFAFVTADLPIMSGDCVRKSQDGISLRVWRQDDIRNDEALTRVDILYGYQAIRPEWACRLIGAASA